MISVVIPVFNERDSLAELHGEIVAMSKSHAPELEMIFVDDGSTDGSWPAIQELHSQDGRVRGLRLRRNFGKSAALAAGFRAAKGDIVITIDADLQDDPKEIPELIDQMRTGFDVVGGWKQVRHDPWHKVLASRVFNFVVSCSTGVRLHDHNCGLKSYRTEVVRDIRLYGELHRFIPVLAAARGFRVGERPVNHRPRKHGQSKFGAGRFLTGLLDLMTVKFLTSFGRRPQHLLGSFGLLSFLFGAVALIYLGVTWIVRLWAPEMFSPIHERALPVYAVAALLFGTQLLSIGFLAELLTAHITRDVDTYSIAEEV
jgi:glycosyltransferase involved in cell wall biosynthesis